MAHGGTAAQQRARLYGVVLLARARALVVAGEELGELDVVVLVGVHAVRVEDLHPRRHILGGLHRQHVHPQRRVDLEAVFVPCCCCCCC